MISKASKEQQSGFPLRQKKKYRGDKFMLQLLRLAKMVLALRTAALVQSPPGTELMMWLIASAHRVIMTDAGQAA